MSHLLLALAVAIACNCVPARSAAPGGDGFLSVSIRPAAPADAGGQLVARAGALTIRNTTLRRIITTLYDIHDRQLAGGPLWIDDEPFDIVATARPDLSREELFAMMKATLAERFHLAIRSELRELPVYELTPARSDRRLGTGLKPAAGSCRGSHTAGQSTCARVGPGFIAAWGTTLGAFATEHLAPLVDRMVLDRTGLVGQFDVLLRFKPEQAPASHTTSASSLPLAAALDRQLGLKLRATSGSVPVIIIDHVERPASD